MKEHHYSVLQLKQTNKENQNNGGRIGRPQCPNKSFILIAITLLLFIVSGNFLVDTIMTSMLFKNICKPAQTSFHCSCENITDGTESLKELNHTANDILSLVRDIVKHLNTTSTIPATCQEVNARLPTSPSGYYHIGGHDVYCHMDTLCGSEGPWTRVAYLDMTYASESCPPGLKLYQNETTRACGRQDSTNGSCQSANFSTNSMSYSQVCGRVIGYQRVLKESDNMHNSPDDINSYYVDGVSITHGYPRRHIWTLMSGVDQGPGNDKMKYCPCLGNSLANPTQGFIGDDYYCESKTELGSGLHTEEPLWDGQGCDDDNTECCQPAGIPWFHKVLSINTTDYIELRVCDNEGTSIEDTPLSYYEIYIQ